MISKCNEAMTILTERFGMIKLREDFVSRYIGGHVNENEPHTCLLKIILTDGMILSNGKKHKVKYMEEPSHD